jgi:serine/threonine-protein kinase
VPAPPGERTEVISRTATAAVPATAAQATTALPLVGGLAADDEAPRRRRRWPLVVALLTVLALIGAVGGWWLAVGRYGTVPRVLGQTKAAAVRSLAADGFKVRWDTPVFSDTVKKNLVATEKPGPGAHVRDGSVVTLALSKGVQKVTVPDVRNDRLDAATAQLKAHHLKVSQVRYDWSPTVTKGEVVKTDPAPGARLPHDSGVIVYVSKGPQPINVPDVVGKTFDDAAAILGTAPFRFCRVDRYSDTVDAGIVMAENPPAGTTSVAGATVTLVVSKGPHLYPVPNVDGMKLKDAIKAIENAGFKADPNELFPFGPGRVVHHSPSGDQPKGTTIRLDYY